MQRLSLPLLLAIMLWQSSPMLAQDAKAPPKRESTGKEEVAFRDRQRESKVWKNKEFEGDWDYKTNWDENPPAWYSGDDPFFHQNPSADRPVVPTAHGDWDYEENWQYEPGPYLKGEDQAQYDERRAQQQQNQNGQPIRQEYEYVPGRGGSHSMPRQYEYVPPPEDQGSWDYRENWQYSRGAYLRGENQAQYYERLKAQERQRNQNAQR